ncbi:hypothetical protein [Clostridium felsineum]|uniref:hypothetical protein n=1 Tax=Clostridium felsineum TaxID=36839 RepID=UPI00098C7751|nr:hypothetical protein [Clostridium felsineum]URZ15338.1 hypothetical protein CLFE_013560 [Clostridium felsineum DSM 794]
MDNIDTNLKVTPKSDVVNVSDTTVDALDILCKMPSREYDVGSTHYALALYAQENKDVCPDLIETMNLGAGDIFYLYDTTKLLYYAVDAIKRLNLKITDLETEIETLKK